MTDTLQELYEITKHIEETARHTIFLIDNINRGNPDRLEDLGRNVIYPILRNTIAKDLNELNRLIKD